MAFISRHQIKARGGGRERNWEIRKRDRDWENDAIFDVGACWRWHGCCGLPKKLAQFAKWPFCFCVIPALNLVNYFSGELPQTSTLLQRRRPFAQSEEEEEECHTRIRLLLWWATATPPEGGPSTDSSSSSSSRSRSSRSPWSTSGRTGPQSTSSDQVTQKNIKQAQKHSTNTFAKNSVLHSCWRVVRKGRMCGEKEEMCARCTPFWPFWQGGELAESARK